MVASVDRSVWNEVRERYEIGDYKTLKELSERFKVGYSALRQRIYDEGWRDKFVQRTDRVLQRVEEKKVSLVESYLSNSFDRAKKYEKMIDRSQEMLSTDNSGTPLLDVDAIVAYSKAELNIHALAKSALRISDKVDVTTGGQSIGESFVTAIARMRENPSLPKLTDADYENVMKMEIVD